MRVEESPNTSREHENGRGFEAQGEHEFDFLSILTTLEQMQTLRERSREKYRPNEGEIFNSRQLLLSCGSVFEPAPSRNESQREFTLFHAHVIRVDESG